MSNEVTSAAIAASPMLAEAFSVRPILFSTPMVQAIMKGQKTQTRRVVKGQALEWLQPDMFTPEFVANPENNMCPYGKVGDMLWVRETYMIDERSICIYKADNTVPKEMNGYPYLPKWKPSIFMPKDACRLFLMITDVRIERLQELIEADARAEGVAHVIDFRSLWKKINGEQSWNGNPFVWVITFERAERPIGGS